MRILWAFSFNLKRKKFRKIKIGISNVNKDK